MWTSPWVSAVTRVGPSVICGHYHPFARCEATQGLAADAEEVDKTGGGLFEGQDRVE